jgi:hypothetical protein
MIVQVFKLNRKAIRHANIIGIHPGNILTSGHHDALIQCGNEPLLRLGVDAYTGIFMLYLVEDLWRTIC